MKSLPERIMEHAKATPEATPICPAALLHLGQRAAVGQALSRLARSGRLMRICQMVIRLFAAAVFCFSLPWSNGLAGNATTNTVAECSNPLGATQHWIADHALALLPTAKEADKGQV